jgi:hypothetical protein
MGLLRITKLEPRCGTSSKQFIAKVALIDRIKSQSVLDFNVNIFYFAEKTSITFLQDYLF